MKKLRIIWLVTAVCLLMGMTSVFCTASASVKFSDVRSDAYYYSAVDWAVSKDITSGVSASSFAPDAGCTRAQVVTFLWRAAGRPEVKGSNPFRDVSGGKYYYDAVLWAVKKGITSGVSKTSFAPDATCTRAQVVSFLWRTAGSPKVSGSNPFSDVSGGRYYYNAVLWAVKKGITSGVSKTSFAPDATCTRAQIVSFLYRFYSPLVASGSIMAVNKNTEQIVRKVGGDLAGRKSGEYYSYVMTLKNNTSRDIRIDSAYATIDGGEELHWAAFTLGAGDSTDFHIYYSNMKALQKPGNHTVKYYINGKAMLTKTFVFSNSKYADFSSYWNDVFPVPTTAQISAYKNPNNLRSQYISGWLGIDNEVRFTEYSIDFKADHVPTGTYCSLANWAIDFGSLEQKYSNVHCEYSGVTGYAGLQRTDKGLQTIMSMWDVYATDASGKQITIRPKIVYPKNTSAPGFTGEGTGAQYILPYQWEESHWYRMLLQCSTDPKTGHTLITQYFCDLETMVWTKICTYDTLIEDTCFKGSVCVFLENYLTQFAGEVRSMEVRNARICLADTGEWKNIDEMWISANGGAITFAYDGSYAFGARSDRFWMITSGVGGDWYGSGRGQKAAGFSTGHTQSGRPY